MVSPIVSETLAGLSGIAHGYFTRKGGASSGVYDSLNIGLGSGDDREVVLANRARIADHLGVARDRLLLPYQIHGAEAVIVAERFEDGVPKADAVVTARPGVAVGVSTADCGPVLFADAKNRVVGAAHAGWRGALSGILEATLSAMEGEGAERREIVAVLGPTISRASYEVGPEFVERFVAADAGNTTHFRPSDKPGHSYFDLPGYIVARLERAGVDRAEDIGHCTYCDANRFFSYRRSVHNNESDYGRLMSAIVLAG